MAEEDNDTREATETSDDEDYKDVPEGGWGWFVVAACFLCNMVNDGIAYSFGIILEPMRSDLDLSIGSVSLIGGALTGVTMLIGPVAAHSVNRFGNQATCILGSVIASCSMYLSSFCSSFLTLFVTYGLLVGVGLGFVYVPAVVAVGEYFRARLSFATGICVCGSGAGTFLIAPLMSSLLEQYGWRMCNRVMSMLCLSCAVYGLVMRPHRKRRQTVTEENNNTQTEQTQNRSQNILRDIPFLLMTLANIPNAMAIYIGYTYLPGMAGQAGLASSSAHSLISMVGISNTVGRVFSGWLAGWRCTTALGITVTSAAFACFLCLILPMGHTYLSLVLLSIFFGAVISSVPTVSTPLIVDLIGINNLNTAFGILTFARGFAAIIGPSAAGFILDNVSSHYSIPFYIASFLFGASSFLHGLIWCFYSKQPTRPGYTPL